MYIYMKNIQDSVTSVEVGMGQFRKAKAHENQHTKYLKVCLGVGFYNLDDKESFMLHYPDLYFYDFDKDVAKVKEAFNGANIKIKATGGSLTSENFVVSKSILKDRVYIENALKTNFPSQDISIDWSGFDQVTNLYLDKATDEFTVERI